MSSKATFRTTPTRTRCAKKRRIDFADLASDTDAKVAEHVAKLVKKLLAIRAKIEDAILNGDAEKAQADADDQVQALTRAQYLKLKSEIDLIDGNAYADALYDVSELLVEVGWNSVRELLDLDTGFDTIPVWAFDEAKNAAQHVGDLVTEYDKAKLTSVLEDALLQGLSSKETAENLEEAFAEGITSISEDGTKRTTKSEAWFKMVARTELQRAAVNGQLALYEAAEIKTVRWQAAEPCDICAEYDDKTWTIADPDRPEIPQHPNCRCVWCPADEDLGARIGTDEDRARARRGNAEE